MRSAEYPAANEAPAVPVTREADTDGWFPTDTPTTPTAGPCAQPRAEVDSRCADAARLAAASEVARNEFHEAQRRHSELTMRRDTDAQTRDRRHIADEKANAQASYHTAVTRAMDQAAIQDAAASWLRSMDATNRRAREAEDHATDLDAQISEIERMLPSLELKADAARISAESAESDCMDARRVLAACEEGNAATPPSPLSMDAGTAVADPPTAAPSGTSAAKRNPSPADIQKAARTLMNGNRDVLLGLALRLADETGVEAGRLQLLLLELREKITARALEDFALAFPDGHPFWSQFPADGARNVAASLASLGYRFDGNSGWADGRIPQARDLAMALSYCGYDPRSLRRPAGQAAVDVIWDGTHVRGEDYLLTLAPTMELNEIVGLLGSGASRFGELWDIWGRLRPLLLQAP
jgi:hypothetical protein